MQIIPIEEHALLVFFVQFTVLLALARGLGTLMVRVGQPSVIGEIGAGVLLGPTLLGRVWPDGAEWLFPPEPEQSAMLLVVGWVGIVLLLLLTGFETDLGLIRQLGRASATVSTGSIVLPFLLGLGAGLLLPASFVGVPEQRLVFALFLATALSISSLPVIAKILSELNLTRRDFGQLTIAAGMANDFVGWLLLGAIASLARTGSFEPDRLLLTLAGMAAFLAFAFTIGQRGVDVALKQVRARDGGVGAALTVVVVVAVAAGAVTQALGVEAVLGAFIAGIVISRSRYQDTRVAGVLEQVTGAVLAPLFFAAAGLRVDLGLLADPVVLLWSLVVLVVASVGKLAGAYVGGRLARLSRGESLALGAGLNARGALEIVVATVGLGLGVLNTRSYTAVVLMAIATSMAAPPLLRLITARWQGSERELRRLAEEETLNSNLLVRPGPLLVPVERPAESLVAGKVLDLAWPAGAPATVLGVGTAGSAATRLISEVFARRPVEVVHASGDPSTAVLRQLRLGYAAVGVGAHEGVEEGDGMSALTERLLADTPRPLLVVRSGQYARLDAMTGFDRILVPVIGTVPNRLAQEVGASAAAAGGSELLLAHVAPRAEAPRPAATVGAVQPGGPLPGAPDATGTGRSYVGLGQRVLQDADVLARRLGAEPETLLLHADHAADALIALVREREPDLVVLGTELHAGSTGDPFLRYVAETLLASLDVNVAVIAAPARWLAARP